MSDDLDSLVKGAPPAGHADAVNAGVTSPSQPVGDDEKHEGGIDSGGGGIGDPLSHTPSSPSMIYLNMLVLEASLRAQYLELRARRRHHTFFLILLTAWTVGFGYALFLAPREDGSGERGGSVYWVVEVTEKVCLMGGAVTFCLSWATGIWDRGIRWPRRWFGVTNRGLRGFNCKLVVVKRPWYAELLSMLAFYLTYGVFSTGSSYRPVDPAIVREVDRELGLTAPHSDGSGHVHPAIHHHHHQPTHSLSGTDEEKLGSATTGLAAHEEDLAPGGDHVKLLLLPKPFSPTFRENWELYRTEYWERENERRALLRSKIGRRERDVAKQFGKGWFWWLPWRRRAALKAAAAAQAQAQAVALAQAQHAHAEKQHQHQHQQHHHTSSLGGSHHVGAPVATHPRHAALTEKEHRRTRSSSNTMRRGSGSAQSSRSTTPTVELDDGGAGLSALSGGGGGAGLAAASGGSSSGSGTVSRKASTASNASAETAGGSGGVGAGAGGGGGGAAASQQQQKRARGASTKKSSGSLRSSGSQKKAGTAGGGSGADSRSVTPDIPSPLGKESSFSSAASNDGAAGGPARRGSVGGAGAGTGRPRPSPSRGSVGPSG